MRRAFFLAIVCLFSGLPIYAQNSAEGALLAAGKKGALLGACPLKTTSVKAAISGFLARVNVRQEFENTFNEPIEAVYTFPLSQNSAVDEMTMRIGERTIRGRITKRADARRVYEQAKTEGKTAALLDQQRPNIFTQAIANILPGEKITIEISYVETLKYDDGSYEFVFPMTIAPRYSPDSMKPDEANKIAPPIAPTRARHDISIEVNLNAGVPVEEIRSGSHAIETLNLSANSAKISLKDAETIPNKDFVLRYDVSGKRIEDAVLTHRAGNDGFFTLILSPPENFGAADVTAKEIVFVLDSSGSMSGFPIEKAKEAINLSLDNLYPHDTFNLITFAGNTSILFDQPVPATQANIEKAREFLSREGAGGETEMMKAIRAALEPSDSQEHVRIVCFMTDGLVGNEDEIIAEVEKHPRARVFSFGIGNSVNRYLLDKIAEAGRGEAEYVSLKDDGSKAARKFYERVRAPLLTDISVDWNNLPVADVYPGRIGDLFSAKPVVLSGRYLKGASGKIRLTGKVGGQDYVREIDVALPESEPQNGVLATLWARTKIDDLLGKSRKYDANGSEEYLDLKAKTKLDVAALGLQYNLLTPFTSFVAVEEQIRTTGGKTRKVNVPVNLPEGMPEPDTPFSRLEVIANLQRPPQLPIKSSTRGRGQGSGVGYGYGSGTGGGYGSSAVVATPARVVSGGVINGRAVTLVKPPYPAAAKAVRASGAVSVRVVIDETGNVVSAVAVGGHPLLRAAAVQSALQSKFAPTLMSGQPVKVSGAIVYNFVDAESFAEPAMSEMTPEPALTPEQLAERERLERERLAEEARRAAEAKYRQMLAEKLHFWVFAANERAQKNRSATSETETKFVRDGKAFLEIRLTAKTPETLEKLKAAGFEIGAEDKTKTVFGKISVENIARLAEIAEVQFVLPHLK
ncbi:MAG TPA: VIT domain-containing protein [Pyrinomonadaceae bacterium]|jgi:Ca-activated chloride channel family protein